MAPTMGRVHDKRIARRVGTYLATITIIPGESLIISGRVGQEPQAPAYTAPQRIRSSDRHNASFQTSGGSGPNENLRRYGEALRQAFTEMNGRDVMQPAWIADQHGPLSSSSTTNNRDVVATLHNIAGGLGVKIGSASWPERLRRGLMGREYTPPTENQQAYARYAEDAGYWDRR